MKNLELAKEIRSMIEYLTKEAGKQDRYALQCCDELDKKMMILDMFQNSLTVMYNNIPVADIKQTGDNIQFISKTIIEYTKNRISNDCKEKLTEWVIENINKETVRYWLNDARN